MTAHLRHERLERLLLEELRALVSDEVTDPRLTGVVVMAATLSVDYRHARVHFALRSGDRQAAERGLARASGFLRARLADALDLKRVPDLRFIYDDTVEPPPA